MRQTKHGRPYIHDGRILRPNDNANTDGDDNRTAYRSYRSSLWKFVEWKRVLWIFVPTLVLFVTNPANGILPCWVSLAPNERLGRPSVTNYGLFSLEMGMEGIAVSGLLVRSDVVCPFYDPIGLARYGGGLAPPSPQWFNKDLGQYCGSLADSFCHRKPFFWWEYPPVPRYFKTLRRSGLDWDDLTLAVSELASALSLDRVHVVHRCLCFLLVLSAVWKVCCPRFPSVKDLLFGNEVLPLNVLDELWTSVLFHSRASTSLLRDLIYQTTFVYPALVEIDTMVPKLLKTSSLVRPTGNETADYLLAIFFLVVVLGGGSNWLTSKLLAHHRSVVGFSSVAAVSLGYLVRMNSSSNTALSGGVWATLSRRDIRYVHAYWTHLAWIFVGDPHDWYPRIALWLVAGLAGCIFCEFHLEHVDSLFAVKNFLGMFGW